MSNLITIEYLARVGFGVLSPKTPIVCHDEDAAGAYAAAERESAAVDNATVRTLLLESGPEPVANYNGVRWLGRTITWPDRVPDLKTWAGQQTLPKIIAKLQAMLKGAAGDLYAARAFGKGASGMDALSCQGDIDIGFSPNALQMDVQQRPGLELLAIVGLESVPLVSFGRLICGFIHDEKLWRFKVESRGQYYGRWGARLESTGH